MVLSGADWDRTGDKDVRLSDLLRAMEADYALNERRSGDRVRFAFRHLLAHFGDCLADTLDAEALAAYAAERLKSAARGTVATELALLRRAFQLMADYGRLRMPKFPQIRGSPPRKGFLEPKELDAICKELPEEMVPMIRFLDLTGWRVSEAQGLLWTQVDFHAGIVRLEPGTTKNRDGRTFPFAVWPRLGTLMADQRQRRAMHEKILRRVISHVFYRWHDGGRIKSYRYSWTEACKRAGYPGRLVHDLRRTAVRRLERAGVARSVAMKLTGHRSERVYARYAITNEADLADGVARLAALDGGKQSGERRQ